MTTYTSASISNVAMAQILQDIAKHYSHINVAYFCVWKRIQESMQRSVPVHLFNQMHTEMQIRVTGVQLPRLTSLPKIRHYHCLLTTEYPISFMLLFHASTVDCHTHYRLGLLCAVNLRIKYITGSLNMQYTPAVEYLDTLRVKLAYA